MRKIIVVGEYIASVLALVRQLDSEFVAREGLAGDERQHEWGGRGFVFTIRPSRECIMDVPLVQVGRPWASRPYLLPPKSITKVGRTPLPFVTKRKRCRGK